MNVIERYLEEQREEYQRGGRRENNPKSWTAGWEGRYLTDGELRRSVEKPCRI